jgi:hypothetical protein
VGVTLSTSPLAFVHAAIPAGFLLGIVAARLARGAIADLAVELGRGVPLGGLRDILARALRDPTLALAFPAPGGSGWVDSQGRPMEVPAAPTPTRSVARLERDGQPLATLVYDPAVEALAERGALPVTVSIPGQRLPADVEAAAYFVIAESLTNAAKHAAASAVHVNGAIQDGALHLSITDDGRGGADASGGSGLVGLVDRLAAIGGTVVVDSPPSGGTRVSASIPLAERR